MTDIQKVRTLIGDPAGASQQFSDTEIQMFLDTMNGSLFLSCALALDAKAAAVAANSQEVRIGDYQTSDRNRLQAIQAQAEKFRTLEFETPAFAIVEDNVSEMNALQIIRNFILRTEP